MDTIQKHVANNLSWSSTVKNSTLFQIKHISLFHLILWSTLKVKTQGPPARVICTLSEGALYDKDIGSETVRTVHRKKRNNVNESEGNNGQMRERA